MEHVLAIESATDSKVVAVAATLFDAASDAEKLF
jgi:hypothetical protein